MARIKKAKFSCDIHQIEYTFFFIEEHVFKNKHEFVEDDADILIINQFDFSNHFDQINFNEYKKIIIHDLFHAWDGMPEQVFNELLNLHHKIDLTKIVYWTQNMKPDIVVPEGINVFQYNTMFNVYKLYHSSFCPKTKLDINDTPQTIWWNYMWPDAYKVGNSSIVRNAVRTKKFICPNKTYNEGRDYRFKLEALLSESKDGYYSDPHKGKVLDPQTTFESDNVTFNPIHDKYYNDSIFCFYCESTTIDENIITTTEKTFVPIGKGIIIVPFSNPFFIKYLREEMNFQFPDFVDYSYDEIINVEERWKAYSAEVQRLMSLRIEHLQKLNKQNMSKIIHNRNILGTAKFIGIKDLIIF